MIFRFVVAHFRWLARVPLLPQLFDAMLLSWTLLTDRHKMRAIELLQSKATRSFCARVRTHRFGGTEFCVGAGNLDTCMATGCSTQMSVGSIGTTSSRAGLRCRIMSLRIPDG